MNYLEAAALIREGQQVKRASWPPERTTGSQALSDQDLVALDWVQVTDIQNETIAIPASEPIQITDVSKFTLPQPITRQGNTMSYLKGKTYPVNLTAKVDNKDAEIKHIKSISVSNEAAAVPFMEDGKPKLLAIDVATGVIVSAEAIVMVDGVGTVLKASSKPIDIIDVEAALAVDENGDPVTDEQGIQLFATRLAVEVEPA